MRYHLDEEDGTPHIRSDAFEASVLCKMFELLGGEANFTEMQKEVEEDDAGEPSMEEPASLEPQTLDDFMEGAEPARPAAAQAPQMSKHKYSSLLEEVRAYFAIRQTKPRRDRSCRTTALSTMKLETCTSLPGGVTS